MMSPDERGLLAAVLESPDDDTPRLVLADWYDENGQAARAKFVRAQIELARLVAVDRLDSDEYVAATRVVAAVPKVAFFDGVRRVGLPLPDCVDHVVDARAEQVTIRDVGNSVLYVYRRGFVDKIEAPLLWLTAHQSAALVCPVQLIVCSHPVLGWRMAVRLWPSDEPPRSWTTTFTIDGDSRLWTQFRKQWSTRPELSAGLCDWLRGCWNPAVFEALSEAYTRERYDPAAPWLIDLFAR